MPESADPIAKCGTDEALEKMANKWLRRGASKNRRCPDRDFEKMAFEYGLIPEGDLRSYDPTGDWATRDSVGEIPMTPDRMRYVEPSICADFADANIRVDSPELRERRSMMRFVRDEDGWGPTSEDRPILGVFDEGEPERKTCTKCGRSKGLACFSKDERNKMDGLYSWCKPCHRDYLRATYEKKNNSRSGP